MAQASEQTMLVIQRRFHDVIRSRAGELLEQEELELPDLASLLLTGQREGWFPVTGMYGGFRYWLEDEGEASKLIVESWCRVVGGSGQRHEISAHNTKLVEQGFV